MSDDELIDVVANMDDYVLKSCLEHLSESDLADILKRTDNLSDTVKVITLTDIEPDKKTDVISFKSTSALYDNRYDYLFSDSFSDYVVAKELNGTISSDFAGAFPEYKLKYSGKSVTIQMYNVTYGHVTIKSSFIGNGAIFNHFYNICLIRIIVCLQCGTSVWAFSRIVDTCRIFRLVAVIWCRRGGAVSRCRCRTLCRCICSGCFLCSLIAYVLCLAVQCLFAGFRIGTYSEFVLGAGGKTFDFDHSLCSLYGLYFFAVGFAYTDFVAFGRSDTFDL